MNKTSIKKIAALFSLSSDSVFGIYNEKIVFSNSSAEMRFGNAVGKQASSLFPEHILNNTADEFSASTILSDESVLCRVTHSDELTVISIPPEGGKDNAWLCGLMPSITNSLGLLRIAADKLIKYDADTASAGFQVYLQTLNKSYFTLLRASQMVNDIVEMDNDISHFSMRLESLREICSDLIDRVKGFTSEIGIEIVFDCAPGNYTCSVDKVKIQKLILNLLSNSVRHCSSGGSINVSLSKSDGKLRLVVSDTGGGMSSHALSRVFCLAETMDDIEPTALANGAGLGLALAYRIAKNHDGSIMLESKPGVSTTVTVLLPEADNRYSHSILRSSTSPFVYGNANSLILTQLSTVLPNEFFSEKFVNPSR